MGTKLAYNYIVITPLLTIELKATPNYKPTNDFYRRHKSSVADLDWARAWVLADRNKGVNSCSWANRNAPELLNSSLLPQYCNRFLCIDVFIEIDGII